jgi:hypothetical protein
MGDKKAATVQATSSTVPPSAPPRLTKCQPPRPGFLGFGLIHSSSTSSAASRPGLDRRRSTKDRRPCVDHRGSHVRHRIQGLSPSRHQHHHRTPGMAGHYQGTLLQQPPQRPPRPSPPRHRPRVLGTAKPSPGSIKEEAEGSQEEDG